jgi:glucokinase
VSETGGSKLESRLAAVTPSPGKLAIGVDVGGSKVAAGLVNGHGEILCQTRVAMVSVGTASEGLNAVVSAIDSLCASCSIDPKTNAQLLGIGICAPGPLDPKHGVIVNPPNLPCWRNFPLATEISNIYRVPVKVDNDANAAALAEAQWGAGRGYANVFYATIGTGIGTGIVLDGRIYHGRTGAAGEGGHVSIDYQGAKCGCGKRGCIEIFAAGPAIAKRARAKLFAEGLNRQSVLLELAGGDIEAITSETVGQAYKAGDSLATEVLRETIVFLAHWLGNVVDFLEPDVMVIGGGVASMLCPFFDEIKNQLPGCCVNSRCQEIPLVMAHYGADAGIAGGGALCAVMDQRFMDQRSFESETHISSEAAPKTLRTIAHTD